MRISRRQQRNHRTVERSGGVKLRLVVRGRGGGGELFQSGEEETEKNVSTQAEQLKNMCPARHRRQHTSPKPF